MSRIGKKPIEIPEKVTVTMNGNVMTVKGPKGELTLEVHPVVTVALSEKEIILSIQHPDQKKEGALWGTMASLIINMIEGVTNAFQKQLEIKGVGYGWQVAGKKLTVKAGYSHPVLVDLPEGIDASAEGNVLTIAGIDKHLVGEVAANIRKIRKPEPYKGSGIAYVGEEIRRKAGKQAASGS